MTKATKDGAQNGKLYAAEVGYTAALAYAKSKIAMADAMTGKEVREYWIAFKRAVKRC